MYKGFPTTAFDMLRCPRDGGALYCGCDSEFVQTGAVSCRQCAASYPIEEGIVRLFEPDELDRVNQENLVVFEHNSATESIADELTEESQAEVVPMMAALAPLDGFRVRCRVLEFGCGRGRYTVRIAAQASFVMAVDFSIAALRKVASRVEAGWYIALVQADVCRPVSQSAVFDRVLCTLTSNLPSQTHRRALYQAAAEALKPDGWFVHGAHHYNLRTWLQGVPRHGFYDDHRIYRYLSGRRELAAETRAGFDTVECRPIQISLPFARRFGLATAATSFRLEKIPVLNHFGELLLVTAHKPRVTKP